MANPQPDQYTKISNELMEHIPLYRFNGSQLRLLFVIIRYTYGFLRKEYALSLLFLSKATGMDKRQVKRELKALIDNNVVSVVKEAEHNSTRVISFNKNYDEWKIEREGTNSSPGDKKDPSEGTKKTPPPKGHTEGENGIEASNKAALNREGTNSSPGDKKDPQERNIYKENIKENNVHMDVHEEFFESVWKVYPEKKGKGKIKESQKKKLYKIGYEQMECAIQRYMDYVDKRRKTGFTGLNYQNGSTFFNSGYLDYLDEDFKDDDELQNAEIRAFQVDSS